ncbi:5'/3'-nucleotidase SurE [Solwaraspora sp. WMMD406]|uniref:5'/3'-nucleotidase SurE n=1 Tax=Solwaraspora sp. WMMD406 TaxID=3016095 RepID=UPI0024177A6A|nr:5'/3'-nucleotidase SurE [Solwaraspora sp. WMMD406]MDG4766313.1 5'/3'-nucleotidase SurE [Solwaraspora sp. WMMD406]
MTAGPTVLITNDDGIDAPGLRRLAVAAVDEGCQVTVAAPLQEASGMSAAMTAITDHARVLVERRPLPGLDDVPAYGVSASPSYIVVLAALGAFGPPPQIVLSGINRGANAGHAVIHSGTVGAALTAAGQGQRAIAFSLDVLSPVAASSSGGVTAIAALDDTDDEIRHWGTAAELLGRLLPMLRRAPAGTVFNVNAPDVPADRLRGLRRARLASFGQVQMAIAESGEGYLRTSVEETGARLTPGTDLADLAGGYATVTPLRSIDEAEDIQLDL